MTIYIIEEIHAWRVRVEEKADRCGQHRPIFYLENGDNFYVTLQNDISFIWKSKLADYIMMEDKKDPLLIRNVVKIDKK